MTGSGGRLLLKPGKPACFALVNTPLRPAARFCELRPFRRIDVNQIDHQRDAGERCCHRETGHAGAVREDDVWSTVGGDGFQCGLNARCIQQEMCERLRADQLRHGERAVPPVRNEKTRGANIAVDQFLHATEFFAAVYQGDDFEIKTAGQDARDMKSADPISAIWLVRQPVSEKEDSQCRGVMTDLTTVRTGADTVLGDRLAAG